MTRHQIVARVAFFYAIAIIIACAPIASATSYSSLPPKASADQVEVFTDVRPDRPHQELGVIDLKASPLSLKTDYGKLILEARQRAAAMGADAIIVTRNPTTSTTTVGNKTRRKDNKGSTYTENTTNNETARISVVAIAWKPGQ
jgi:hypothetical protein